MSTWPTAKTCVRLHPGQHSTGTYNCLKGMRAPSEGVVRIIGYGTARLCLWSRISHPFLCYGGLVPRGHTIKYSNARITQTRQTMANIIVIIIIVVVIIIVPLTRTSVPHAMCHMLRAASLCFLLLLLYLLYWCLLFVDCCWLFCCTFCLCCVLQVRRILPAYACCPECSHAPLYPPPGVVVYKSGLCCAWVFEATFIYRSIQQVVHFVLEFWRAPTYTTFIYYHSRNPPRAVYPCTYAWPHVPSHRQILRRRCLKACPE